MSLNQLFISDFSELFLLIGFTIYLPSDIDIKVTWKVEVVSQSQLAAKPRHQLSIPQAM